MAPPCNRRRTGGAAIGDQATAVVRDALEDRRPWRARAHRMQIALCFTALLEAGLSLDVVQVGRWVEGRRSRRSARRLGAIAIPGRVVGVTGGGPGLVSWGLKDAKRPLPNPPGALTGASSRTRPLQLGTGCGKVARVAVHSASAACPR